MRPIPDGRCSTNLNILPESDPALGFGLGGSWPFVDPGVARMPYAIDHHVIELDAVWTGAILLGHGRLLEPLHTHRPRREIAVTIVLHNVVALGNDLAVQGGLHGGLAHWLLNVPVNVGRARAWNNRGGLHICSIRSTLLLNRVVTRHVRYATRPPLERSEQRSEERRV